MPAMVGLMAMAMEGAAAMKLQWQCNGNGNGWRNGNVTAMKAAVVVSATETVMAQRRRRQWMAHRQHDGNGRRDGNSSFVDNSWEQQ